MLSTLSYTTLEACETLSSPCASLSAAKTAAKSGSEQPQICCFEPSPIQLTYVAGLPKSTN